MLKTASAWFTIAGFFFNNSIVVLLVIGCNVIETYKQSTHSTGHKSIEQNNFASRTISYYSLFPISINIWLIVFTIKYWYVNIPTRRPVYHLVHYSSIMTTRMHKPNRRRWISLFQRVPHNNDIKIYTSLNIIEYISCSGFSFKTFANYRSIIDDKRRC